MGSIPSGGYGASGVRAGNLLSMNETPPPAGAAEATEKRDRVLRRLIAAFVLGAVVTFWTAVGMSAWNRDSVRVELARQEMSRPATPR